MKNTLYTYVLSIVFMSSSFLHAAFDGNYVFSLETLTQTQIDNNITAPQTGMMVFNTTSNSIDYYNGTNWINNTATAIPYITDTGTYVLNTNSTTTISIHGQNFTPTTTVSLTNPPFTGTINTVTATSPNTLEVNITTNAVEDTHDIVLSNDGTLNTQWAGNGVNQFVVQTSTWADLRLGGTAFTDGNAAGNDIRYRTGMTMLRDANGMYFTGAGPWNTWVKFEIFGWSRGSNLTTQWIFTQPTSVMMIGIGSTATNESSTAQYQEAEVEAYFSASTTLWGLYGNNGTPGSAGNQSNSTSLTSCTSNVFKTKLTQDGSVGGQFTLYCLPSASQATWDDESNVLTTFTIGGSLNPGQTNIMPFIIPRNGGTQRFIAVKVQ